MKTLLAKPLITEKSLALATNGVYQFIVPQWATKNEIANYIARHFNVTVTRVTSARVPSEQIMFRRQPGERSGYKKATVMLKKGDSITEFSLPVETPSPETPVTETPSLSASESTITVRSKSKKAEK